MDEGIIDFIQPKKDGSYIQRGFQVTQTDLDLVIEQMKSVYRKILNYEFQQGCDSCEWCKLGNQHFVVDGIEAIPTIDED